MSDLKIVHNPRCSKSRQTLQLLEEKGYQAEVIEYLKHPLTAEQLSNIVNELGFSSARQLLRKGEDAYKEHNLKDPNLSEAQLIHAMLASPKLIERPIVRYQGQAKIGRPPESVLDIL